MGHKSIHSLAIYQKVQEDDKLSMGISLTYSLLHLNEVNGLLHIIDQERKALENKSSTPLPMLQDVPVPNELPYPQQTIAQATIQPLEKHALDPSNNNILPLDGALVPYEGPNQDLMETSGFDLGNILNKFSDSDQLEEQMVLAATQVEQNMKETAIMKKNGPVPQAFNNCTFGNIGTLNIHIHKH